MPRARIRMGREIPGGKHAVLKHGMLHPDYDSTTPTGVPGPKAKSGDVIDVTNKELFSFPDKLQRVLDDTPLTYSDEEIRQLAIASDLEHADPEPEEHADEEAQQLAVASDSEPEKPPAKRRGRPKAEN